jgi:CHAT domain-containing protein
MLRGWLLALGLLGADAPTQEQSCPPPELGEAPLASPSASAALSRARALRAAAASPARDAAELRAQLESLIADAAQLEGERERIDLWLHAARTLESVDGGQAAAARTYLRAAELAEQSGERARRALALGLAGDVYLRGGRADDALALTRQALFLASESGPPETLWHWHGQLARVQQQRGDARAELESLRRAVQSVPRFPTPLALGDGDPLAVQPGAAFSRLVDVLLSRAREAAEPAGQQALLREARDVLERQKSGELRDYFRDRCLESQEVVPSEAIPGALVVYPVPLADRLELLVSHAGALDQHVVPVGEAELRREVLALRRGLERRGSYAFRPQAERVYDWLVRPLAGPIAEEVAPTLVFIPGGILRTIPLAALRDRESGKYLVEQLPAALSPGLTLTEPRPIARERAALLAAGLSESREGRPPLPHVPGELDAVTRLFPGVRLVDAGFSTRALQEQLSGRAFDMVHIASHGEFSPEASESFLLTHDGRIGMEELAKLVGVTRFRERPLELLTLSACETAAGDERAALGLAGIAVRSGARSALASLWSLDDEATAALVERFYRELQKPGVSRASALQRAQLHLLADTPFKHPGYWAPFVLINSWL